MQRTLAPFNVLFAVVLGAQALAAQVTEYTDRPTWEAAAGSFQTIGFTGFAPGTLITNQYSGQGVDFTDGSDFIANLAGAFVIDGFGIDAAGGSVISFSSPQTAFGVDFPGAIHIELRSGGTTVYSSSNFAGSGVGFFAGVTSVAPFDEVVLTDWFDNLAFYDDISWGGGGGFVLTLSGSCPGTQTGSVSGATPNGGVAFIFAQGQGSAVIPGGLTCGGTTLGLDATAFLVGTALADANGNTSLVGTAPAGACGGYLQALDLSSCATSNVEQVN